MSKIYTTGGTAASQGKGEPGRIGTRDVSPQLDQGDYLRRFDVTPEGWIPGNDQESPARPAGDTSTEVPFDEESSRSEIEEEPTISIRVMFKDGTVYAYRVFTVHQANRYARNILNFGFRVKRGRTLVYFPVHKIDFVEVEGEGVELNQFNRRTVQQPIPLVGRG